MLNSNLFAQNTFRAIIKDAGTKEPLPGISAVLEGASNGASSDESGILLIKNIPNGKQVIRFSCIGFEKEEKSFIFPIENKLPIEIYMREGVSELSEVVISSTRGTGTITNIPTRIELIAGEELKEEGESWSDIRRLLTETAGIQTQQTSAISGNAFIRIQGLDGRYTQILKDGFPLYSGAASGLGLLQIPPLDLKQVEIIKGSTSTLYGGGAIAGMINLISKTPVNAPELSVHVNGISTQGLDVNSFYSQRFDKIGLTILATRSENAAFDPAGIGFSAIPKFERYNFNPHLFVYFDKNTTLDFAVNTVFENRLGGDMNYIRGKGDAEHRYFEDNNSKRVSTQFSFERRFNDRSKLTVRNSYNYFHRIITIPDYSFDGRQNGTFSEINYLYTGEKSEWVMGANLWTDNFAEKSFDILPSRNYNQTTFGLFAQNIMKVNERFSIESGLRGDYVLDYGFALLPRVATLINISKKWTSRIGGGLGYKIPTIFTEESETLHYRNVLPVTPTINKLERSYGVNADVSFKTPIGDEVFFSINQLFFYTYLNRPLMLSPLAGGTYQSNGTYQFQNIDGHIDSKGAETSVKITVDELEIYLGYTYTDPTVKHNGARYSKPLTPKHRLNNLIIYEIEGSWRFGLEAFYYGRQYLDNRTKTPDYWLFGFLAEKIWKHISVYANIENITDRRQTRFENINSGTVANPVFREIYAPLDGVVANLGVKIKLF